MLKVELAVDGGILTPLEITAPEAARIGIRGIEFAEPAALDHPDALDRFLRGYCMRVACFRMTGGVAQPPAHLLAAVRKVGSNRLLIVGEDDPERAARACLALSEQAVPMGLRPVVCAAPLGLDGTARFCELVGPDQGGLAADTGEIAQRAIDPDALIERLAGRLEYVRLKDIDDAGDPVALGRGRAPVAAFLKRLDQAGYIGWITFDVPDLAALESSREFVSATVGV